MRCPSYPCLLCTVAVFGLCIHAENALQAHELEQRLKENSLRREARIDLARRGLVATETEIAKWKEERTRAREAAVAAGVGRVTVVAWLVVCAFDVASVFTVAYAFVPFGEPFRERTNW